MGGTAAYLIESVAGARQTTGRDGREAGLVGKLRAAGATRYLQGAAVLHVSGLAISLSNAGAAHHTGLIAVSLLLIMLALWLSNGSSEQPVLAAAEPARIDVEAPRSSSTPDPAPLPFIGERILLNTDHSSVARLSKAAARLSQITAARSHPWGELMARVSHELRTPLNAVIGFSDVMDAELLGPVGHPRYREYARHIRDCGRELLKSAEDTLAITCLLEGERDTRGDQLVDLSEMLGEAWHFYRSHTEARSITLQDTVPAGLELIIERRALRQILINLFAEALRRVEDQGTIGFTAFAHGDLVQIEVFVRGRPNSESVGQASLPVCLARALLEMQGAALVEVDDPSSTWRALTVLKCAAQQDFFSHPHAHAECRALHVN